jgi:hypothetical protein
MNRFFSLKQTLGLTRQVRMDYAWWTIYGQELNAGPFPTLRTM